MAKKIKSSHLFIGALAALGVAYVVNEQYKKYLFEQAKKKAIAGTGSAAAVLEQITSNSPSGTHVDTVVTLPSCMSMFPDTGNPAFDAIVRPTERAGARINGLCT